MKHVTLRYRARHQGLSLVELMIAIAISLFLVGAVGGIFIATQGTFRYQTALSRIQENARFSMAKMSTDIRMAGFTGCGNLSKVANTVSGGTANWWLNLAVPITGYEGGVSTFPAAFVSAVAGTDAIVVLGVDSSMELSVLSPPGHNAAAATIPTTQHSIKPGEILVITDCSQTSIFQMSGPTNNTNNATQVNHNTGGAVSPGNCNKELGASCPTAKAYTFKPGSTLLRMYASGYYIRPSATLVNGVSIGNSLWRCSLAGQTGGTAACSELINGVENMQIEYGVDADSNGSVDWYGKADAITDWTKVTTVKLNLLFASPVTDANMASKSKSFTFDGTTIAADRRVRHVYTSVINLRNRTK